ncbi:MAG TPA: ribonuclease HIII [Candidatus Angelobacter sp.]|nr:ribonuclease HIII [Candidatus Angelobacter sp.]
MGQSVLQASPSLMTEMKQYYIKESESSLPPGSLFRAKRAACTITAYKSGKVLFQGKDAEGEASKWLNKAQPAAPKKSTSSHTKSKSVEAHSFLPPSNIKDLNIIGSDEVGTGDFFGPMTVAACLVSKDQMASLQKLGVKDSKNLTDDQISAIANELINEVEYCLLTLPNEKYNELRAKGITQIGLKALLHQQAQLKCREKIKATPLDGYLVDQFTTPDLYFKSLGSRRRQLDHPIFFKTKGESVHLSVAAASIIARDAFVREMDRLSEWCGMVLPKGAGAHVDVAAAKLIKQKGYDFLNSVAKLHFSNTERAKDLAKK